MSAAPADARGLVLLLVPPSRGVVIRDYYCSKRSQARYLHPPIDLVVQGGHFRAQGFRVELLDATVDQLSTCQALQRAVAAGPDAIFALAGAVSWDTDAPFLSDVARKTGAPLYASGDLFMERPVELLGQHAFLAGVLTDFTSDELARHLSLAGGSRSALVLPGDMEAPRARTRGSRAIPIPAHDLFTSHDYRYPFARRYPMAGVYASYGCPYTCSFCITGELGTSMRPAANVIEELRTLASLGVHELFFQDQCFGCAPRAGWDALLDAMIAEDLQLGWWTFTRVDVIDRELLRRMKRAGCHTLILGVESSSDEILRNHRKGYGTEAIRAAFRMCEEEDIRTAATFILGLPEETAESIAATIDFACSLPADYASFNVAVPRAGTRLREQAVAAGTMDRDLVVMDQSGFEPVLDTAGLSAHELQRWRRRAVARFYLRPGYLWRRLRHLRTRAEMFAQAREAWSLLRHLATP